MTLDGVSFTYDRVSAVTTAALSDVSLVVQPAELVLVLGATGSGKSTLLRIMAGLLAPKTGSVALDGVAMTAEVSRGTVGLVFQDAESQLFADTLLDDVAFGPLNMGAARQDALADARDALSRVGLDPDRFGGRSPFTLSGGEARRAAIAGVLAMRPRYLLADEPTAGLDSAGRRAVVSILEETRRVSGVVVVSHTAEDLLAIADRVLVLRAGRVHWFGEACDLVADPTPLVTAGLIAPDVLEVQRLAGERGYAGAFTLDVADAAHRLSEFGGCSA